MKEAEPRTKLVGFGKHAELGDYVRIDRYTHHDNEFEKAHSKPDYIQGVLVGIMKNSEKGKFDGATNYSLVVQTDPFEGTPETHIGGHTIFTLNKKDKITRSYRYFNDLLDTILCGFEGKERKDLLKKLTA